MGNGTRAHVRPLLAPMQGLQEQLLSLSTEDAKTLVYSYIVCCCLSHATCHSLRIVHNTKYLNVNGFCTTMQNFAVNRFLDHHMYSL